MSKPRHARCPARKFRVGFLALLATAFVFAPLAAGAAGDLDPSFGNGGKVVTDFAGGADYLGDIAVQRDGKIVAVGGLYNPDVDANFGLARYNPNGSLDSTFGSDGKVRTDFGPERSAWGEAITIQPDGKIVAAGAAAAAGSDFALARYNSDGSLDSTFGGGGRVVTDLQEWDYANDLAIQPDGKIVVVGQTSASIADRDFALARYNSDGSLDTSFGGVGFVTTPSLAVALSVVIQPDGRIVAAGFAHDTSSLTSLGLARYNPDGSLDTTFDGDGKVETQGLWGAWDVALQTDGKIVAAARAVARYNADGSLDTGFGSNGISSVEGSANVVLVQAGRKLIVAGNTGNLESSDLFVARLDSQGSSDDAFGQSGQVRTDLGSNSYDTVSAASLQADNRIVVAGSTRPTRDRRWESDFALVRYLSEPPCRVPNVRGKKLPVARSAISKAHCSVGKVKRKTSNRVKRNRVISQSPKARTQLPNLGKVNLVVSRGRK